MNLAIILKALGVKIAPESAAQIQALIPQIPGKVNELIKYNVDAVKRLDERLEGIERRQHLIMDALNQIKEQLSDGKRDRNLQRTSITAGAGNGNDPGAVRTS